MGVSENCVLPMEKIRDMKAMIPISQVYSFYFYKNVSRLLELQEKTNTVIQKSASNLEIDIVSLILMSLIFVVESKIAKTEKHIS